MKLELTLNQFALFTKFNFFGIDCFVSSITANHNGVIESVILSDVINGKYVAKIVNDYGLSGHNETYYIGDKIEYNYMSSNLQELYEIGDFKFVV